MKKAVIVAAKRTPVGKYLGSLKTVEDQELLAIAIKAVLEQAPVNLEEIHDVIAGKVISMTPNVARNAALLAGLPESVPGFTIDRQCGSSLQAVISAAEEIRADGAEIVIACGTESMSRHPYYLDPSVRYEGFKMGNKNIYDAFTRGVEFVQPVAMYPGLNMGLTAENVAKKHNISREEQDAYALESQQKAYAAQQAGRFDEEIVPVSIERKREKVFLDKDEHLRPSTTMESLSKLRPAFLKDGTVTAGNASGMNDGASAVIVTSDEKAQKLGYEPLVEIVSYAVTGVDPALMGLGPVTAIEKALEKAGLTLEDMDLIEINEAFAAQTLGCLVELGITKDSPLYERFNVNGGAVALGHALGSSGTRVLITLIYELLRRKGKYGVASLCIGGGQGIAMVVKNPKA